MLHNNGVSLRARFWEFARLLGIWTFTAIFAEMLPAGIIWLCYVLFGANGHDAFLIIANASIIPSIAIGIMFVTVGDCWIEGLNPGLPRMVTAVLLALLLGVTICAGVVADSHEAYAVHTNSRPRRP